ncbi:DUF1622 domain-containing protein [Arthrobacter sp. PO-11]|uniref:DUF1622 domain-containing protein n=1 Tax=Arthrobacter cavernae TaxID=2817681 RepID=A0A939HCK6_9MICC|nr:DUF1622 domain-containing protein [Arthrobacter cavernae]
MPHERVLDPDHSTNASSPGLSPRSRQSQADTAFPRPSREQGTLLCLADIPLIHKPPLLGLELLVAADIIRTLAIASAYESVGVLAIIVAIRTFLSFSLELEITGRWRGKRNRLPVARSGG